MSAKFIPRVKEIFRHARMGSAWGEGETKEMGNDCYLVIWKEFKIWVLKEAGTGIQTLDQLTARWIKENVSERKKTEESRQKECEKPRSYEKMFGVAPQFSGWLKERQTRKGATSATTCPVQEKRLWKRGL